MLSFPLLALAGVGSTPSAFSPKPDTIALRARELHFHSLVADTHVDVAQRFFFERFDMGHRDSEGSVDIPRLREGGVGALFCAAWIPSKISGPPAVKRALDLLERGARASAFASGRSRPRAHGRRDSRRASRSENCNRALR